MHYRMSSLDLAGRMAALVLVLALCGNSLLVAVTARNTPLQYAIVALSTVSAIGLLGRLMWPHRRSALARSALLSAVVWALSFLSVGISSRVTLAYTARQASFYLAFFVASVSLYYVERLHLMRKAAGDPDDT